MNKDRIYLNPKQVKRKVLEFLEANAELEKQGLNKNALSFVGLPGIAKTSSILQLSHEYGIPCEKVNMANIDDLGEITGYPMKEYLLTRKEGDKVVKMWANDKNYDLLINDGWQASGSTRTGYAEPKWVNSLRGYETSILLLDDSLRAQPRFINALMDLIQRGEYYGWKLPKGVNIIMTNNPSDGDFFVSQEDSAHTSRYFTFYVKYCEKSWAEQAQKEKIQGPFINFILKNHSEIFGPINPKDPNSEMKSMPRQWTMLFYSINHLKDLSSPDSQRIILENGKAILPADLVNMFTTFLHSKEWDIPEPSWIFDSKVKQEDIVKEMKKCIGDIKEQKAFRSDVASIMSMRMINYLIDYSRANPISEDIINKLKAIMENKVLGSDLDFKVIKDLYSRNTDKFKILLANEFFRNEILNG